MDNSRPNSPSEGNTPPEVKNVLEDEEHFETSVLAEEKRKASALTKMQLARTTSANNNLSAATAQSTGLSAISDNNDDEEERSDDDSDEDSVESQEQPDENVRQAFFQTLESYPISTDFQRVHITQTGDDVDPDTIAACGILKECMQMREKWIGAHPTPPQDGEIPTEVSIGGSPSKPRKSVAGGISSHSLSDVGGSCSNADSGGYGSIGGGRATQHQHHGQAAGGGGNNDVYRRRRDLRYDVFSSSVPSSIAHKYSTEMRDGVIFVIPLDEPTIADPSAGLQASSPAPAAANKPNLLSPTARVIPFPAEKGELKEPAFTVPSFEEYVKDFVTLKKGVFFGPTGSYCYRNLEILTAKFNLHTLLNSSRENDAMKTVPHRDFYNIRKVDTHVHHSACMNQKHLLRFIKNKLKTVPNEVVIFRDGKFLTLGEVFKSLKLTAYDLSVDTLDMHANNTFHRFDRFNLKYNPAGQSRLREIFLKTDNVIGGRYLAEITKEVMSDLEASKYQLVEWRISVYGRKASEWDLLSRWFYVHKLAHSNVRWLIQIPRLYHIYKRTGEINSFEDMLYNIFAPLYAVSIDPSSNPALHYFLKTIVAFDSVDDESRPESSGMVPNMPKPHEWTGDKEPPYSYWMYYLYANICALNKFRASRNLCTFQLRPHCGEAGDLDHLISAYLLAHQINHGILLRKLPALHYLYYVSQVGIAMSPLSNNKLFLDYNKNPFPKYFSQGLNVSLSTDDPLMLHYTKDALVEEYSVAAQVWKLSATDQSEIARNSVIQSGWEHCFKKYFLGDNYEDMTMTNVPVIRLAYRQETLAAAINEIHRCADYGKPKSPVAIAAPPPGGKMKSPTSASTSAAKVPSMKQFAASK